MSGGKVLDTNIVIYLFNGDQQLAGFLNDQNLFVSSITELELLSYHQLTEPERQLLRDFLDDCTIIELSQPIKELVIKIRSERQIKLPDAIVAATAAYLDFPLITADKKLEKIESINTIIYEP